MALYCHSERSQPRGQMSSFDPVHIYGAWKHEKRFKAAKRPFGQASLKSQTKTASRQKEVCCNGQTGDPAHQAVHGRERGGDCALYVQGYGASINQERRLSDPPLRHQWNYQVHEKRCPGIPLWKSARIRSSLLSARLRGMIHVIDLTRKAACRLRKRSLCPLRLLGRYSASPCGLSTIPVWPVSVAPKTEGL